MRLDREVAGVPVVWSPAQATGAGARGPGGQTVKCRDAVPVGYALVRSAPDRSVAAPLSRAAEPKSSVGWGWGSV
jgi:hypothetical protein